MQWGKAGLALGISIVGLAIPASAGAKINCHNWSCVNNNLNRMQATINRDDKFLSAFTACFTEMPVTSYSGYNYTNQNATQTTTTALDITETGSSPEAWVMIDKCNKSKAARDHRSADSVFGPIAPAVSLSIFGVEYR